MARIGGESPLGLEGAQLANAKAGILIGSGVAMVLGLAVLSLTLKRRAASE